MYETGRASEPQQAHGVGAHDVTFFLLGKKRQFLNAPQRMVKVVPRKIGTHHNPLGPHFLDQRREFVIARGVGSPGPLNDFRTVKAKVGKARGKRRSLAMTLSPTRQM